VGLSGHLTVLKSAVQPRRHGADQDPVLAVFSLACGCGVLAVAVRWWLRRTDGLGRPRPVPWYSLGLFATLAIAAAVPVLRTAGEESRLSAVASALAGAPARVRCQSLGAAFIDTGAELGFVRYGANGVPEHSTLIKHEQCGLLASYLAGGRASPPLNEVVAVHVLTHESMHMAGLTSESAAECAAVQRDARTAQLLGATSAQGWRLARLYWQLVYPELPSDYQSPDCTPGGALDERLIDPPWAITGVDRAR
jgi:hypothetical protein